MSMATHAAYRLLAMLDNAAAIVAIELLAGARGLRFRRPLRTTRALEAHPTVVEARFWLFDERSYATFASVLDLLRPA